ncbi:hypothetical protein KR009_010414, partial [Drosophila setifemur]
PKFSMFQKLAEDYEKFKRYVKWLYLLYELNTQIAICEPWEKVFCNVLLGSCASLFLYATCAYIPGYCLSVFNLVWPLAVAPNLPNTCIANSEGLCGNESGAVLT